MKRRASRLFLGLGLATALSVVAVPAANAKPAGNNGTVKVDKGDLQGNDNNPHVGCQFNIEWFGFDSGSQTSTVTFEGHAPTGGGTLLTDTVTFTGSGPGSERDTYKTYDLTGALQGITPHPKQGWHVDLTVTSPDGSKHKTFWVSGCEAPSTQ